MTQTIENRRITLITGHYGSGKTEFAVNYALALAARGDRTALVDLDIANPYFRSRERQALLEAQGIAVYSNVYHTEITAELPAITASIRAPLEHQDVTTVVDAGGDAAGAMVLIQFRKYFQGDDCELLCVINANRPDTATLEGALEHVLAIQRMVGIPVSGLVNNTHMLRETRPQDIVKGQRLCAQLSRRLEVPIRYTCCMVDLAQEVQGLLEGEFGPVNLFPIEELKMRESWLDVAVRRPHRSPIF